MSGEVATLLNWTDAIDFQSEARPWLAIQKAWALALSGDWSEWSQPCKCPKNCSPRSNAQTMVRTMQGTITAARRNVPTREGTCIRRQNMHDKRWSCCRLQFHLSKHTQCGNIDPGDASWFNGDVEEARRAYTEAVRIGREAGNLHMVIIASISVADILMVQGQLHRAADMYTQCLQMAIRPDGQRSPLAANIFTSMARLFYEWNRLDDADQHTQQCIDLCRQWGDIGLQANAHATQARIEQARGIPNKPGKPSARQSD